MPERVNFSLRSDKSNRLLASGIECAFVLLKCEGEPIKAKEIAGHIVREPLVWFFLIALLLFMLQKHFGTPQSVVQNVSITPVAVDTPRVKSEWKKEWGRAPTKEELDALIAQRLREELLFTEAERRHLARNDALLYRRLVEAERTLITALPYDFSADETTLRTYYNQHIDDYREDGRFSFAQVFVSVNEKDPMQKAQALLQLLRDADVAPQKSAGFGDKSDAAFVRDAPAGVIEHNFGKSFYKQLRLLKRGRWYGPIISEKGLHLVYVTAHHGGRVLPFSACKSIVEEDYRRTFAEEKYHATLKTLQQRYAPFLKRK